MKFLLSLLAAAASFGCSALPAVSYEIYRENMPMSIVVLPPLEETIEVGVSYDYLSTLTRPLAERGYYVFPPAMVASMLRENGLPTPFEMHQASPAKLREVFGADAALYVTLEAWGTRFRVIQSVTEVEVSAQLVDLESGIAIWEGEARQTQVSGGVSLLGRVAGAVVAQVAGNVSDRALRLADQVNTALFYSKSRGLLRGPLHPLYEGL